MKTLGISSPGDLDPLWSEQRLGQLVGALGLLLPGLPIRARHPSALVSMSSIVAFQCAQKYELTRSISVAVARCSRENIDLVARPFGLEPDHVLQEDRESYWERGFSLDTRPMIAKSHLMCRLGNH